MIYQNTRKQQRAFKEQKLSPKKKNHTLSDNVQQHQQVKPKDYKLLAGLYCSSDTII